jgi:hypothetical protein
MLSLSWPSLVCAASGFFKQRNANDNIGIRILNVKYFAYSLENESDY